MKLTAKYFFPDPLMLDVRTKAEILHLRLPLPGLNCHMSAQNSSLLSLNLEARRWKVAQLNVNRCLPSFRLGQCSSITASQDSHHRRLRFNCCTEAAAKQPTERRHPMIKLTFFLKLADGSALL
jgi:hypothetical protein